MRLSQLFIPGRSAIALASMAALATTLTLSACGGGGSPSKTSSGSANSLSGTAAIGQPISGQVVAIDINGKVSPPATTTALGAFVVNVNGMSAPFVLTITGTAGGRQVVLNSIASAAGQTVNITPLTDLIVSTASGAPSGTTLAALCTPVNNVVASGCTAALSAATNGSRLNDAVAQVSSMIAPLNTAGTNPLTGSFQADGTGMDRVLDQILVSPALNNGGTATVTLIATNTDIGQVALSNTPGATPTVTPAPPSNSQVTASGNAANALPEIKACMAAFSAMYPSSNFTAPSPSRVAEFVDASFRLGVDEDKAAFVAAFSDASAAATPGFTLEVVGLAPYDMSPLDSTELATLQGGGSGVTVVSLVKARTTGAIAYDGSGQPTSAWVHLRASGDASPTNWKLTKGTAYTGCPGGWRLAGTQHADMHMNARISRYGGVIYREWAFHIGKDNVLAENASADTVVVKGPGLSVYTGNASSPVGTATPLTLILPTGLDTEMRVKDSTNFYVNAESIQSCQDLAKLGSGPAAGTPCIDETQVAPGKLYSWVLKNASGGTIYAGFPFQIQAVPLSTAYATANAADLFANITAVTPATASSAAMAIADFASGDDLSGVFTISYTQSTVYGSRADNCGLSLRNGATEVLRAEQNAVNHETSCTFNTASLNSGSLSKPVGSVNGGFISVTTTALGNQISTGFAY